MRCEGGCQWHISTSVHHCVTDQQSMLQPGRAALRPCSSGVVQCVAGMRGESGCQGAWDIGCYIMVLQPSLDIQHILLSSLLCILPDCPSLISVCPCHDRCCAESYMAPPNACMGYGVVSMSLHACASRLHVLSTESRVMVGKAPGATGIIWAWHMHICGACPCSRAVCA